MKPIAIRELRLRLGESQAEFGKRFDVSQIAVAYWESGRSQPSRQRVHELAALAANAAPAPRSMLPFRPIQYLGSKQRLAETIASVIDDVAPERARVGDLFAGSGVVSALVGTKRPVTAVDMQTYSAVVLTALLQGRATHYSALIRPEFRSTSEELASHISRLLAPILDIEMEAMANAANGKPDLLVELIECGSIAAHAQRTPKTPSFRLAKLLGNVARDINRSEFTSGDLTATCYFGGPYFSYRQAIALDAIYTASRLAPNADLAPSALAVLLSVASDIVNTVGKQFAQPMKLRKADGKVSSLLLHRTLRDRSRDVYEVYKEWASRWMAKASVALHDHRVVRGDVLDFLSRDCSCEAWYADPPYTIDHYSRFYHVLETLSLRDSPCLDEMNKRGERSVMRGIYRVGRYQSPFCVPSQAPMAFDRLFAAAAKTGSPLVLSYSPFDEGEGQRPRLLTLKEMIQTAKNHYSCVELMEIAEHSHRKLNSKTVNKLIHGGAERLLVCKETK